MVAVATKVVGDHANDYFQAAIHLGLLDRGHFQANAAQRPELCSESGCESWDAIRDNRVGQSLKAEYLVEKAACDDLSCVNRNGRDKIDTFCEAADKGSDTVKAFSSGW